MARNAFGGGGVFPLGVGIDRHNPGGCQQAARADARKGRLRQGADGDDGIHRRAALGAALGLSLSIDGGA